VSVIGNLIKAVVAVVMIAAVVGAAWFIFTRTDGLLQFGGPETPKNTGEPVVFVIEPNETVSEVADRLQQEGLIDSSFTFRVRLKLLDAEGKVQAGRYQLTPGMDLDQLIGIITTPQAEKGIRFTVIEGQRIEEVAEKMGSQNILSSTTFLSMTTTPDGMQPFMNEFMLASGKPAESSLEGFLFPDTYEVKDTGGDNSEGVIKVMLSTLEERITPQMRDDLAKRQINGQPATIFQMLTIASIVQREGVVKEELPDIAAVFWNRVDEGMLLNADPTIQYAVGQPGNWWPVLTLEDLQIDSPYNSYTTVGLPPGPISSPGLDAIRAAIYPSDSNYLYFVAKNDGSGTHAFAETLEEHERNRVLYGNR
jgi:UPF0755 protein